LDITGNTEQIDQAEISVSEDSLSTTGRSSYLDDLALLVSPGDGVSATQGEEACVHEPQGNSGDSPSTTARSSYLDDMALLMTPGDEGGSTQREEAFEPQGNSNGEDVLGDTPDLVSESDEICATQGLGAIHGELPIRLRKAVLVDIRRRDRNLSESEPLETPYKRLKVESPPEATLEAAPEDKAAPSGALDEPIRNGVQNGAIQNGVKDDEASSVFTPSTDSFGSLDGGSEYEYEEVEVEVDPESGLERLAKLAMA
jgi:hypothetical protein